MSPIRTMKKAEILGEVLDYLRTQLPAAEVAAAERFLSRFYANASIEDIAAWGREKLFGAGLSLWRLAARRKPDTPLLRVYNPRKDRDGWETTHTVVEVVNDDMPFLVESVANELNRQDLAVELLLHPVVTVRRKGDGTLVDLVEGAPGEEGTLAESFMHLQVSRQPDATLDAIRDGLASILAEVRLAVDDWEAMSDRVDAIIAEIEASPPPLPDAEVPEGIAFLRWIRDNHFTFLGYRAYDLSREDGEDYLRYREGSGLGILRPVSEESRARHARPLAPAASEFARRRELLILNKAFERSRVHRTARMDYVGVRTFGPDGEAKGEHRFIGLFTSAAYNERPRLIPALREKVRRVMERGGFAPKSHDGRALLHILETYPRDELIQTGEDELLSTALAILQLRDRPRPALFVRRDPFERFVSCLAFVPREEYATRLRRRIQAILEDAFQGTVVDFYTEVGEAPLARIQYIVKTEPGKIPAFHAPDVEARVVEACRSWPERLKEALVRHAGEERGLLLWNRYREAFPTAYSERFAARTAVADLEQVDGLGAAPAVGMDLYRRSGDEPARLRLRVYAHDPVPLSDILPVLENLGLRVVSEVPYLVRPRRRPAVWIHDFDMVARGGGDVDLRRVKRHFQELLRRVWGGGVEDDGFNQLVLRAGLEWREIVVLRAYCKYLRQAGIAFSEAYMQQTLAHNPLHARLLVDLFRWRFDPDGGEEGARKAEGLKESFLKELERVTSPDEDRILRRFLNLVLATVRTNYFQVTPEGEPKEYLSFKFDSARVEELPLPRPMFEVFVYSPRLEAVHLRGGKVARGGIRWSDRREDFRTEILGLVKAQMVKNAVIVPVGAKGGFVVKRPPAEGGAPALRAEAIACYQTMMRGLLDLTDNMKSGSVNPPVRVLRHDADDPYLVVAADKGTATFSDIANGVAREYGFWLDDAFASGGSAGYDHKKMGITAKGGWEAVKRHFRELGKDIQATDFDVVGVGDMAGDVFGNGMLLSRHIRLIAAFNHQHLFVDPAPDPAVSFAERERIFALPQSTWEDYDASKISRGGGVWKRSTKAIPVSAEMATRLDLREGYATPSEVMRAILKARCDLLWLGGIGTFVKARMESNSEVGDRANDALRVDGRELRCKVVGEGANLGLTQRGRVEFALRGGKLNTDAIDNSGGVDCSDHEVNIKIAFRQPLDEGAVDRAARDALLGEMTDEVSDLVLRDNYLQTQALTVEAARTIANTDRYGRLMRLLERNGKLDRAMEQLPDDETLAERAARGQGLTRPELAVLLAYSKIALYEDLLDSDLPDDPLLEHDLVRYFPKPLAERFRAALLAHPLRREIIATCVTNSMVNRVGPTFVSEMIERTGRSSTEIARAYAVARDVFDLRRLWTGVEALDTRVPASVQTEMLLEIGRLTDRCTRWFLRHVRQPMDMRETTKAYTEGVTRVAARMDGLLAEDDRMVLDHRIRSYADKGVPADLARAVAVLDPLAGSCDIVRIASNTGRDVEAVAGVHFRIGSRFGLDRLRLAVRSMPAETEWDREATAAVLEEFQDHQRALTASVVAEGHPEQDAETMLQVWSGSRTHEIERADECVAEIGRAPKVDFPMLTVAARQIRALHAR